MAIFNIDNINRSVKSINEGLNQSMWDKATMEFAKCIKSSVDKISGVKKSEISDYHGRSINIFCDTKNKSITDKINKAIESCHTKMESKYKVYFYYAYKVVTDTSMLITLDTDYGYLNESARHKVYDKAARPTYHGYPYAGKMFKGVAVELYCNGSKCQVTKEQRAKFNEDFSIMKSAYDEIFKSKFIPWVTKPIKNDEDKKDAERSMKLYDVTYTIRSNGVGEFDLQYNFSTKEENNVAVGIYINVKDGKISSTRCYEI